MTAVARIRPGHPSDVPAVLALLDGQHEPFSGRDAAVARVTEWAASGGLRIAEDADGAPLGAIVLGARPPWVAPADEPERYVEALVTSRGEVDAGGELIRRAVDEARGAGVGLLRVDCWGDAPDVLAWYERQGFRRSGTFELEGGWHGHVLSLRLDHARAA